MRPHIKISLFLLACIALYFVARFAFAGSGILELDSQPGGADVFVDGKMKGVTPEMQGQKLTMELSEGEHEVVFKKEGVGFIKKQVFMATGVIQPLSLALAANGILELDSQPGGADIFVDGRREGVTPEVAGKKLTIELSEGHHEVVLKKTGMGLTKKILIVAGTTQPLTLALTSKGILELTSYPGAEVFADGKRIGLIPVTDGNKLAMELPEGTHEVAIKMENAGSANTNVFIEAGTTQRLMLPLAITGEAFTNPLGMKFVRVPGTKVLMCIHETRNKDYAAFAAENRRADQSWKNVSFDTGNAKYTLKDDAKHPVVNVSWEDATAFCAWLGRKDGQTYRLPTDHEWSCAVGIGEQENARDTPEAKSGKVLGFPWGDSYPPPNNNVGNYGDSTLVKNGAMGSYDDGNLLTAPVMSYPANKLGIFDLGGNVWEWCEDRYLPTESARVLRGASWRYDGRGALLSSHRRDGQSSFRNDSIGFRCVAGGSVP